MDITRLLDVKSIVNTTNSNLLLTRLHRRRMRRCVNKSSSLGQPDIGGRAARRVTVTVDEVHREANIKRRCTINLIEVLIGEAHTQSLHIRPEMLNLALTDDGEHVRCLVHDVSYSLLIIRISFDDIALMGVESHNSMQSGVLPVRNLLQCIRDLDISLAQISGPCTARFGVALTRLRRLELAPAERCPGSNRHSLVSAHGNYLSFEVSESGVPSSLVHRERTEAVGPSVIVGLDDNPGRGVGDTEVENLARCDEVVESMHDFFHGGGEVPPVQVEEVDVVSLEFLETSLDGDPHALHGVADEIGLQGLGVPMGGAETGCVLGCDADESGVRFSVKRWRPIDTYTIWSRFPRAVIHSPIHFSDSSN